MKRSNTFLFAIFLIIILVFLFCLNLFKDSPALSVLDHSTISIISALLILLIIFSFIFREIQNNKIEDEFITIITHKFKTPLTGIRWTIDMLQKNLTLLEKKDLLLEMQKANERLMEIVDLLVGFANFDKRLDYNHVDTSLHEVVETSFTKYSAMAKSKNIKVAVDSDKDLPLVIVDRVKMQFVVDMLIDNAIKYTPAGGSVTVTLEAKKGEVLMKVKDTGIGMGFFDSRKIFGHFFRSKEAKRMDADGLGLGLYTAKKIVKHHQGKLWGTSKGLHKGSTFYLCLPAKV